MPRRVVGLLLLRRRLLLAIQFIEATAQILRLTPQLFLLPALVLHRLSLALLFREFLLTLGQLFQLADGLAQLLLAVLL